MANGSSLTGWYDQRPLRERVVLLVGAALILMFLVSYLLIHPVDRKNDQVKNQIAGVETNLTELKIKEDVILARKDVDPERNDRERLASLQEKSAKLEQQLQEGIVNLVPPQEMPELLKDLLTRQDRLELISLENLAPQRLIFSRQEGEEDVAPKLYRHSLRMTFSGDYLTLLKYLYQLEQLPRTLIWEDVEITNDEYPHATVRLQVYSLSLMEGWIGG